MANKKIKDIGIFGFNVDDCKVKAVLDYTNENGEKGETSIDVTNLIENTVIPSFYGYNPQEEINKKLETIRGLNEENESLLREVYTLKDINSNLAQEKSNHDLSLRDIENNNNLLKQQISNLGNEKAVLEGRISTIAVERDTAKINSEEKDKVIAELQNNIDEYAQRMEVANNQIKFFSDERKALLEQLTKSTNDVNELQEKIKSLEEELEDFKNECEKLTKNNSELNNATSKLLKVIYSVQEYMEVVRPLTDVLNNQFDKIDNTLDFDGITH